MITPQNDGYPHLVHEDGSLVIGDAFCEHTYSFYKGIEGVYGVCDSCGFHHWAPTAQMLEGQEVFDLVAWAEEEEDEDDWEGEDDPPRRATETELEAWKKAVSEW